MSEIAAKLGLSRTTVSLCLSGKAEKYKISPKTVERVLSFSRKHGFVANAMAQSLSARKSQAVGILFDLSVFNNKHQQTIQHLVKVIAKRKWNYHIQHFSPGEFIASLAKLKGLGASSIIIIGSLDDDKQFLDQLKPYLANTNLYFLDYPFSGSLKRNQGIFRIGIDRQQAYLSAFDHLYKLGHRNIAIDNFSGGKIIAYKAFLKKYNLPLNDNLLLRVQDTLPLLKHGEILTQKVTSLFASHKLTAVSLHDDEVAAALITGLKNQGIGVPEDISVLGFDNITPAPLYRVPLSSIEVPVKQMVNIALSHIFDNKTIKKNTILEGELIIRKSIGLANKHTDIH